MFNYYEMEKIIMIIKEDLKLIYKTIMKMDMLELKQAYEDAKTEEELELYRDLFIFRLRQNQKQIINEEGFVI